MVTAALDKLDVSLFVFDVLLVLQAAAALEARRPFGSYVVGVRCVIAGVPFSASGFVVRHHKEFCSRLAASSWLALGSVILLVLSSSAGTATDGPADVWSFGRLEFSYFCLPSCIAAPSRSYMENALLCWVLLVIWICSILKGSCLG